MQEPMDMVLLTVRARPPATVLTQVLLEVLPQETRVCWVVLAGFPLCLTRLSLETTTRTTLGLAAHMGMFLELTGIKVILVIPGVQGTLERPGMLVTQAPMDMGTMDTGITVHQVALV